MGARVRLLIIGFIALGCLARTVSGDVTLFSTNFGDNYICNGDAVIIKCTTDTGVLRWFYGSNTVFLNTGQSTDTTYTLGVFSVTFVIEGQDVIASTATSNLTSEFNETSIECQDAITDPDERMVTLYIAGPPGPPIDFMNVSSTFSSVTLSWLAPLVFGGGVNVTSYNIEITQPDGILCSPNQCLLSSSDLTTTIDNLASNVQYMFSITASTCGGIGSNASLSVYVEGRAPDPPMQLEACISLENSGTQLNLQATWQCPDVVNDIFVPPVLNYRVSVAPYLSNSAAYEKSILADCRCAYSTGVFIDEAETLYNIGVSSNNSIGSGNEKRIPIYSSANISSEVTQIMSSSILLAISVSWQACPGTTANIIITYSSVGSSALPLSVMTEVTLPASRVFIPLNNLILGTMYKYSVALESSGGLTLGLEEEMTFETNSDDNIIVQTVCTSRSRQEYTQQLEPTTSLAASEKCSSNSTTSLLIGICVIGVALLVALSLFAVTLMCCIRIKYKAEHSDYATVSTPPSIVLKNENWTTNMNQSYGQCDTHLGTNSYKTPPPETYEEIRSSAIAANTNPEFETPRPPAELPTLPVYVDPNTNENMEEKEQSRRSVANPSYGKSEKELISTPEDYLIVTDSKKINVYD